MTFAFSLSEAPSLGIQWPTVKDVSSLSSYSHELSSEVHGFLKSKPRIKFEAIGNRMSSILLTKCWHSWVANASSPRQLHLSRL